MKVLVRFIRLLFRFTWHILAFIVVLVLCFHFWFIYHSEKTIEDLITWASDGKLKTTIKKFRIDYINNTIDIKDLIIVNTDSSSQLTSYRFTAKDFHLNLRSRWNLIFHKRLLIDSVVFNNPDIVVTRSAAEKKDTTNKKLLLAEELGNVYKAITQSLNVFNLQRFEIIEGKVLIKDAGNTGRAPFRLSHIFLSVDKFNIDTTTKNNSTFIFSDRILLRINDQHILLPDNKSNISFKELLIDSKEKMVRIINPAVNILPFDNQKNSLIASAPALSITGLDFNELYQHQMVKADSVFLQNPKGDLEIYTNEKTVSDNKKKKTPLDSTLHQLPVSINIGHIVLQHGDGSLHLFQGNKMTSFQTKNDNVNIAGIRINDSSGTMLDIDGFNYTARNYVGYTPDSIYRFGFDSLQFINNKVVLHHFTAVTVKKVKAALVRDYTVPLFEITGMDWFSFILDNHFKAQNAVLYNPVLHIEKNNFSNDSVINNAENKKSIYQTLSVMDSILDLEQLKIINGNFSFKQSNTLNLQLQKLNLFINADELTKSKTINQLVNSVKQLSFDTATANNSSGSIFISKSDFNNKNKNLILKKVVLDADNMHVGLNGVSLKNFSFNNNELEVNGIHWNDGNINIIDENKSNKKLINDDNKTPVFLLNNISGNNTTFVFENKKLSASFFVNALSANSFIREKNKPFSLKGLLVAGSNAKIILPDGKIICDEFVIRDKEKSFLKNISFEQKNNIDSLFINVPSFSFIPFINETISTNSITADSVKVFHPNIFLSLKKVNDNKSNDDKINGHLPLINMHEFDIDDANVQFNVINKNASTFAESKKLSVHIKSVSGENEKDILARNLLIKTDNIIVKQNDSIDIKFSGNISAAFNSLSYNSKKDWQFHLDNFTTNNIDYTNRKFNKNQSLFIYNIRAENANGNKNELKNPLQWLINNSDASIGFTSANWKTDNTNIGVRDFSFNQNKKQIIINSFEIDPGKSQEDFIHSIIYREDFMQASSQKIIINGIEMNKNILHIPLLSINNAQFNIYSDKLKLAGVETLQPLPVAALLKIPFAVQTDKIAVENMKVNYKELNEDTKHVGEVFFTNINGSILDVQSKPNENADSLRMNVTAKFLDTMKLHLVLNESYKDSLTGLNLQLQLGKGDLTLLNPFLVPLVSMRAKSGYVDTMSMNAIGNEYFSNGNMRLFYHGLKADILDSGNVKKKKFGTKLLNFFANTIAIKNDNKKRVADFHFVRLRKKSTISYFLKMVVQGAAGSVAPISKIIYRKEYKKAMKQMTDDSR